MTEGVPPGSSFNNGSTMLTTRARTLALFATLAGPLVSTLVAQSRVALPAGSVILVKSTGPLESATARVGQTFETVVADTVRADDYTVIPGGSRIRGVITFAQPA